MDPISILSLLSAGSSLLTGKSLLTNVVDGVEGLLGEAGAGGQQFAGLLNNVQSSLNVTPQGGILGLQAEGAASLVPANSGEVITDETLQSLNDILGSTDSEDIDSLAETDVTNNGGLLNGQKLDDPFGIKAAEANGSPIATVVSPTPVVSADSGNIVTEEGDVVQASVTANATQTNSANANAVDGKAIAQQAALSNVKVDEKKTLVKLGEKVDANAEVIKNQLSDNNKILQAKSELGSNLSNAEKLADKATAAQAQNPAQAAFAGQDLNRAIGEAARNIRSKEELKDKLAEVDTYKVVNVTKRDNVIDLRLEPAHLGKVQIKFDFTDGKTNIMVLADRPETLDMLQKDTKSIQKILTDNGIQSDSNSMSFNLRQQQQQQDNNFNFFGGKPLSFRVEEEISKVANNNLNIDGYGNYTDPSYNGLLNIMV